MRFAANFICFKAAKNAENWLKLKTAGLLTVYEFMEVCNRKRCTPIRIFSSQCRLQCVQFTFYD